MRRAWVLAVVFAAACGAAAGDVARPSGSAVRPRRQTHATVVDHQPGRVRAAAPPADDGESREWPPPASREPPDPPPPSASRVVGRVVDARGAPAARANVAAFFGGYTVRFTEANRDGAFELSGEPTGVVRCLAWSYEKSIAVGEWFALRADEAVDVGTLRCGDAAPIEGWIAAPDGSRTYGAVIIEWTDAFDAETWALVRKCAELDRVDVPYLCSGAGGFHVWCLPPGRYRLRAAADGEPQTVTAPSANVALAASPPRRKDVGFQVRVFEHDGTPVTEFEAEAGSSRQGAHVESEFFPGANLLRVTYEDRSEVHVSVTLPDGRTAWRDLDTEEGGDFDVTLARPDATHAEIRGIVTLGGRPLAWKYHSPNRYRSYGGYSGTRVYVVAIRSDDRTEAGSTQMSADGSFVLADIEAGTYDVWATVDSRSDAPDLAAAHVQVVTGGPDAEIELPVAQSRSFHLVLPDGFGPIDDDDCSISGPDGEHDAVEVRLKSRRDGALVANGLRENVPYSLSVRVGSGTAWTATTVVPAFTSGDDVIDLRLSPGLRIEGTVTRNDGSPVVGAYVYAEDEQEGHSDAYASLDGTFVLTGLDPGRWKVETSAPGFAKCQATADAGTTGVRIVMQSER